MNANATKPTPSWRDVPPIHPAAELFPLMSPDELRALGEDIKKNGLKQPIAITSDEQLLDGRNRLDAMEMVGIEFEFTRGADGLMKIEVGTNGLYWPEIVDSDPYTHVMSANIHRRHLTAEQKRELIAALLKAQPEKLDRQIAETVKVDHHKVSKIRKEEEDVGKIPHVETRTDTKGRKQPASKPARAKKAKPIRGPTHVCWQCGRRGKIGEVKQHPYAQYDDVWLHDACISAFDQAEQQRDAAAERINALMGGKTEPRDDIGSASNGEIERLQAEKRQLEIKVEELESKFLATPSADDITELQAEKWQRDETIAALRRRITDLEHAALDIPPFLRRAPLQLLDQLEQELRRIGVDDAAADLRRIRRRIEGARPQINLTAVPAIGSA